MRVLGCCAATFRQAVCIRVLVVNTTSALSCATSSSTCSASTSGLMFSRQVMDSRSGNARSSASRPLSWLRTQALFPALFSCRNTTFSSLGLGLKMFSLASSGSPVLGAGSSESSTACGSVRTLTSFHSFSMFCFICAGVLSHASE